MWTFKMRSHGCVPVRVQPGYTNLCHTAKSHAPVLGRVEHTDLVSN
ncbi:hypothetical protein F383_12170 [Gossypium arboreum]|uniref:Uncharacterized protein n=1 Tax=Gossypium arboreum TaxID=29729 RepID=A0A0B0N9E3_GOSAR|nr:hypothetical protein F383_12170 [Gossypium arboreum]